eukprot:3607054-Pyramimonas_sp.AAC.1
MSLKGIRTDSGAVIRDPAEVLQLLGQHWGAVFGLKKNIDQQDIDRYLERHAPRVCLRELPPPTMYSLEKHLNRLQDSAPGPDGLVYSAWRLNPMGLKVLDRAL